MLLRELESLDLATGTPPILEAHRPLTGYMRHNLHRMDDPTSLKCRTGLTGRTSRGNCESPRSDSTQTLPGRSVAGC